MTPAARTLCIVIPCFDESQRLPASLERIRDYLRDASLVTLEGRDVSVLVVDDGSRDGTADIARETARRLGLSLEVVRHEPNRGKGFAVRRGLETARADLVLLTDSDLAVPIELLDAFLERAEQGADLVIGSRRSEGAIVVVPQSWLRRTLGSAFYRIADAALGTGVSDFTCGFKLMTGSAAREIAARQRLWGWGYDVEMIAIARALELQVAEVPVEWRDDARTRVRLWIDIPRSALDLVRVAWNRWRGRYAGTAS